MATPQPAYPPKATPLHKGLQNIKEEIDRIIAKMQRSMEFLPDRAELDAFSAKAVQLIQQYHPKMPADQKLILNAVIDLTEIPIMHPKMQRLAYQTALKEASNNLGEFL